MITKQMRYQGCMMGLAAGDALGTTVEFKAPGSFFPLSDMYDGGRRVTSAAMAHASTSGTQFERLWKILRRQVTLSPVPQVPIQLLRTGGLLAVNLGDDADTTGAVYGQLAGAFYGIDDIPGDWLEKIPHGKLIERLAKKAFRSHRPYWQNFSKRFDNFDSTNSL